MTWISTPKGLYGESGIRTHGTLTSTHAFQACTFGHSVISPGEDSAADPCDPVAWRRLRSLVAEKDLAERVGFEPTEPQAAQRFSRPPDSTALASLRAPGRRERGCVQGCTSRRASNQDGASAAAYKDVQADAHPTQDGSRSAKYSDVPEPTELHGRSEVVACMDAQATTELPARTARLPPHGWSEGLENNARSSPRIVTREATELFVPKRIRTSDL